MKKGNFHPGYWNVSVPRQTRKDAKSLESHGKLLHGKISSITQSVPAKAAFNLRGCWAGQIQPTVTKQILITGAFHFPLWPKRFGRTVNHKLTPVLPRLRDMEKRFTEVGLGRTCKNMKTRKTRAVPRHLLRQITEKTPKRVVRLNHQGLWGNTFVWIGQTWNVSAFRWFHGLSHMKFYRRETSFSRFKFLKNQKKVSHFFLARTIYCSSAFFAEGSVFNPWSFFSFASWLGLGSP